jgi:hypothetical protein
MREKAIACEEVEVDFCQGGALRGAEFRSLNPFGRCRCSNTTGWSSTSRWRSSVLGGTLSVAALAPVRRRGAAGVRQLMFASGDCFSLPLKRWLARLFTPKRPGIAPTRARRIELGTISTCSSRD